MFKALPPGTSITASPNHVVGLHRSLNSPAMSLSGGEPVDCRAHVIGLYNQGSGQYTLYVNLDPVDEDGSRLYRSNPDSVPIADYRKMELAALELVKRYGFIMERLELSTLSESDRDKALSELPLVATDASGVVPPEAMPGAAELEELQPLTEKAPKAPLGPDFDLGVAPEEAIAVLGRLMASF